MMDRMASSRTITVVGVEGRRMMRLARELSAEQFDDLLKAYHGLVPRVLEEHGGRDVEVEGDSASAAFAEAKQAVLAAAAVRRAVSEHEWPHGLRPQVSIGLHSGDAEVCDELCDAAEGGQIFASAATAGLLEDEELGGLALRDLGEVRTRRGGQLVRAYELVEPSGGLFDRE
jgi:class 3 adenylate cyclase